MIVPDAKKQLYNVDRRGDQAREDDVERDVSKQRLDHDVHLSLGVAHKRARFESRRGRRCRSENEVDEHDEKVAAEIDDECRFADDDGCDVVQEDEGDDLGVDELLGESEVLSRSVNVFFEEIPDERDGFSI